MKKIISLVIPTYNEENNVENLYKEIQEELAIFLDKFVFHIIFIDNSSNDKTLDILKKLAITDKNLKIIVNNRNFGHIRSPYYGILQSYGEATIYMASDFQDPPKMLKKLINKWINGSEIVFCKKKKVEGKFIIERLRTYYYLFLKKISGINIVSDATGFGIYDKKVIKKVKEINDPLPFFRGLVAELGYKIDTIEFDQPTRHAGESKNNFLTLVDYAIHGMISHSTLPLRIITLISIPLGLISLFIAVGFFILKIVFWSKFQFGFAPLIISIFFLFSMIFISFGIIGEYISNLRLYIQKRPIVVEKERINFETE